MPAKTKTPSTTAEAESQDGAKSRAWAFLTRQDADALAARAKAEGVKPAEITLRAIRAYLATPLPSASMAALAAMVTPAQRAALDVTASVPMAASAVITGAYIERIAQAAETLEWAAQALNAAVPTATAKADAQAEIRENLAALADGIGTVAADVAARYGMAAEAEG